MLADCAYPARTEALPSKLLRGIHHHPGVLVRFELGQGVVGVPAVPSSNRIALASVYQVFGPSPTPRQWSVSGGPDCCGRNRFGCRDVSSIVRPAICSPGGAPTPSEPGAKFFDLDGNRLMDRLLCHGDSRGALGEHDASCRCLSGRLGTRTSRHGKSAIQSP